MGELPGKSDEKHPWGAKLAAEKGQNIVDCGEEMQQGLNRPRKKAKTLSNVVKKCSRG
jgi:hypothetical protein